MSPSPAQSGITAGRLSAAELKDNFADLHPAYQHHEATVAADRCYFCHDAPCITACPTDIDIPLFIRQIQTGQPEAAAKTIFDQNILGGMCARVCPTETLCEQACVREMAEGKPVEIGRLQRHATDSVMAKNIHPYTRAAETGHKIAVIGAGPAGLACAHRLAMKGHTVEVFEARAKAGGLNEFGIAAYKSVEDFAASEVDWLLKIGGLTIHYEAALGDGLELDMLRAEFDAVFLGMGLGGVNALQVSGSDKSGVDNAVSFISELRQTEDLGQLAVGRHVVVIGGGMTAIDAAVQSKLLGAQEVTVAYRRGTDRMGASKFEQDLATSRGVRLLTHVVPLEVHGNGAVQELELAYVDQEMQPTGETVRVPADQVLNAIGQTLDDDHGLDRDGAKIAVTGSGKTSLSKVWAGGDCAFGGDDLTVTAVAEGRDAAEDIHKKLMS